MKDKSRNECKSRNDCKANSGCNGIIDQPRNSSTSKMILEKQYRRHKADAILVQQLRHSGSRNKGNTTSVGDNDRQCKWSCRS